MVQLNSQDSMKPKNSKSFLFTVAVLLPLIALAQISGPQNYASVIMTFLRATTAAGARTAIGAGTSGVGSDSVNFDTTQFTVAAVTNVTIVSGATITNTVLKGSTSGNWTIGATGNLTADTERTITTTTGALTLGTGAANGNITLTPNGTGKVVIGASVSAYAQLQVFNSTGQAIPALGVGGGKFSLDNGNYGMLFGVTSSGNGWIQQQRTDASAVAYNLLLNPNGGSVGIGTSGPTALLHLSKNIANGTIIEHQRISAGNANILVSGTGVLTSYVGSSETIVAGSVGGYGNGSVAALGLWGQANSGVPTIVVQSANVGIATTTPGEFGLAVNHATGQSLDLIYNDSDGSPANHCPITVTSGGNLTIVPSGGTVNITGALAATTTITSTGNLISSGGRVKHTKIVTATYTLDTTTVDEVVVGNHATVAFTVTMLAASGLTGRTIAIKNKGAAVVTIDATSLGQIDGANTIALTQYQSATLVSDGATWNRL